jgi:hypothetical protein
MYGGMIQRGLDSKGISRGVKNREVFPAAYMDVLAAAREMPFEARPCGLNGHNSRIMWA